MTQAGRDPGGVPAAFVVDASALIRGLTLDKGAGAEILAEIAGGHVHAHAPGLIVLEVGNALALYLRTGRLALAKARAMLRWVIDGPVERHEDALLAIAALEVSTAVGFSVYDGLYAVLAESLGVPLVTADRRLAERSPDAVLVV